MTRREEHLVRCEDCGAILAMNDGDIALPTHYLLDRGLRTNPCDGSRFTSLRENGGSTTNPNKKNKTR